MYSTNWRLATNLSLKPKFWKQVNILWLARFYHVLWLVWWRPRCLKSNIHFFYFTYSRLSFESGKNAAATYVPTVLPLNPFTISFFQRDLAAVFWWCSAKFNFTDMFVVVVMTTFNVFENFCSFRNSRWSSICGPVCFTVFK